MSPDHRDFLADYFGSQDSPDYRHADRLLKALDDVGLRIAQTDGPAAFVLVRDEDVTGVSGTGVVAEGVEFTGGVVALRWLSDWPTSVVFHDKGYESVVAVHGHGGKTRVVYT